MSQTKRPRKLRDFSTVNPTAAAIDIGAKIHVAAVSPSRDKKPVRTFRTFTDDLYRLADWFAGCGIKTVVMESTGVYWIPVFEILGTARVPGDGGQRSRRQARARTEDRCERRAMAATAARIRLVACQLPAS